MEIPIELLLNNDKNVYELTCAIIKRVKQLDKLKKDDEDKIPIMAISQVLEGVVDYRLETNEI